LKRKFYSVKTKPISSKKLEQIKIVFQFLLILILSVFAGVIISKSLSDSFYINSTFKVSTHFETVFIKCSSIFDCVKLIALYSLPDICSVFIIFIFSFFTFNCVFTNIVLIYNGIRFGVISAFLVEFSKNTTFSYNIGNIRFFIFIFLKIAFLIILLNYSYTAALSSISLKATSDNGRPDINKKEFLGFAIKTITYLGIVLILDFIYCCFIYISK
jgi:hypothetical protein